MNKLFLLFSILIMSFTYSSTPKANKLMKNALNDAANKIGEVQGFTAYEFKTVFQPESTLSTVFAEMLYLKDSEFKMIFAEIYTGSAENVIFNNEVIEKFAATGTWTEVPEFTLIDINTDTNIIDKNGFNTLYILTPQTRQRWMSKKIGGMDTWEDDGARNYYLLMKEEGDNIIFGTWRSRPATTNNTYYILAYDLTNSNRQNIYNKK